MSDEQAIRARLADGWPEGEGIECRPGKVDKKAHPCPRQLQHVQWLLRWYARGLVA